MIVNIPYISHLNTLHFLILIPQNLLEQHVNILVKFIQLQPPKSVRNQQPHPEPNYCVLQWTSPRWKCDYAVDEGADCE